MDQQECLLCNVFGQIRDEMSDGQKQMRAAISGDEEMTEADQEQIRAEMRANQDKMEAIIRASQEKMKATINVGQEKIQATISSIWSAQAEFKEAISKQV
jgi:predicted ribonuclease toxin of YeeF-YezG toxin-antitoxin module